MHVAAFQFDVRTADVAANLATVELGLRAAADAGVSLVVLPEMWPTSFPSASESDAKLFFASDEAVARVAELSRELALVVCGSAFGVPGEPNATRAGRSTALAADAELASRAKPTNRLHVLDRGELVAAYDKVHLFSPTAEDESFAAGDAPPPVVDTSAGRIGAVICYDLRFPELVRHLFHAGAEIVVVPAQWPSPRASHWRALVAGRAVESQAFVVACNRSGSAAIGRHGEVLEFPGNSRIVDPDGDELAHGEERPDPAARTAVRTPGEGPRLEKPLLVDAARSARLVTAKLDLDLVRRLRTRVPVAKDERPELYATWRLSPRAAQRFDPGG